MFELIGNIILRCLGFYKSKPNEDVFGSFYERDEGPIEFIVGLLFCLLVIAASYIIAYMYK